MPGHRPNVLLIVSDQECGRDDIPAAVPLPQHDRLAAAGVSFARYHVATTPCTPSRSVIYTGRHTRDTGIIANTDAPPWRSLPTGLPTIGHRFREAGYVTAYKGKWHLGNADPPRRTVPFLEPSAAGQLEPYGFSDYSEDGDRWGAAWDGFRHDRAIASEAVAWLSGCRARLGPDRPWLLAVNLINPHDIMFFDATGEQAAARLHPDLVSRMKPAPVQPPYDISWDHLDLPASFGDDLSGKPWAQHNYKAFNRIFFGGPDEREEAWRRYRSYYFNCLRDVDANLGVVLDALEASGEAGRTIVAYTSDHGEMAGAHGLSQKGPFAYRENVRVPLIVAHPDGAHGSVTAALGSAIDLLPTLLGLAGIAGAADRLPGVDLSPVVADPSARTERDRRGILFYYGVLMHSYDAEAARDMLVARMAGTLKPPPGAAERRWPEDRPTQPLGDPALFRGIFDGRFKFCRYFRPSQHHRPADWETLIRHNELELYDLAADPDEMVNLAAEPEALDAAGRARVEALNERLNALIATEIGEDDGREFPGPRHLYRLDA